MDTPPPPPQHLLHLRVGERMRKRRRKGRVTIGGGRREKLD